jgi:hypothetical protein
MGRAADPQTADRNRRIVEAFRQEPFHDYAQAGKRFNIGQENLYRVLRDAGLISASKRKKRCNLETFPVISPVLQWLGNLLEVDAREKGFTTDINTTPLANAIGVKSAQYLRLIFLGKADLLFTEIGRIAVFMGHKSAQALLDHVSHSYFSTVGDGKYNLNLSGTIAKD